MWALRCRKVVRSLRVALYRRGLLNGVLAATEHEPLLRKLSVDTVIDVGANRGQFSLVVAHVFPNAEIVAFEPLRRPARKYRAVVGNRAVLHEFAAGAEAEIREMFETEADDSSSLLQPGDQQVRLSASSRVVARRSVEVRRLDEVLAGISSRNVLLKIDVQGFELAVLSGSTGLLRDNVAFVYVEASFRELYIGQGMAAEVVSLLERGGFSLERVNNPQTDGSEVVQADLLFSRKLTVGPHE
jgi:FkbM family methyltransferase